MAKVMRVPKIKAQDKGVLIEPKGAVSKLHEFWLVKGKRSSNQNSSLCHELHFNFGEFLH